MRLQGKTVIVTGSGSGFGEGIAKTFAREGANVFVNDLNRAAAERVASEIVLVSSAEVKHGRTITVQGDVTKRKDWQKLHDAAINDFGSVQVVVNNAGTTHRSAQSGRRALRMIGVFLRPISTWRACHRARILTRL